MLYLLAVNSISKTTHSPFCWLARYKAGGLAGGVLRGDRLSFFICDVTLWTLCEAPLKALLAMEAILCGWFHTLDSRDRVWIDVRATRRNRLLKKNNLSKYVLIITLYNALPKMIQHQCISTRKQFKTPL